MSFSWLADSLTAPQMAEKKRSKQLVEYCCVAEKSAIPAVNHSESQWICVARRRNTGKPPFTVRLSLWNPLQGRYTVQGDRRDPSGSRHEVSFLTTFLQPKISSNKLNMYRFSDWNLGKSLSVWGVVFLDLHFRCPHRHLYDIYLFIYDIRYSGVACCDFSSVESFMFPSAPTTASCSLIWWQEVPQVEVTSEAGSMATQVWCGAASK